MAGNLSISSGQDGASQTATSNPQTVPGASGGPSNTSGSGVQPGTTSSLLTNSAAGGIPLGGQNPTIVDLGASATTVATSSKSTASPPASKHEITPLFGVISASLIVIFIISIVWAIRSAKSTTNY